MTKYYDKITLGFYEEQNKVKTRVELTDEEWQDLLDGQSEGKIITLEGDSVVLKDKVYTFDELKIQKLAELKSKREAYKKTVIIKDNISLCCLEVGSNKYENMMYIKYGWIQAQKDLFIEKMDELVVKYDIFKNEIKNATTTAELNNINIIF